MEATQSNPDIENVNNDNVNNTPKISPEPTTEQIENKENKEEVNIGNASPAILITNLAPSTTEKNLADFFSFCGKITSLSIRKKGNQTVSIVHFETEAAAKTALLLSNAMVNEQPIKVTLYSDEDKELHRIEEENSKSDVRVNFSDIEDTLEITDMPVENITVRNYNVPDEDRTATSVIASMIAAGYGIGFDALNKAKQIDEEKSISKKFQAGTELMKAKAKQIDEQFRITEQASNIGQSISNSWHEFDQNYHISENTSNVIQTVNQTVSQSLNTALENPSVQNAVQSISSWGSNLSKNVSAFIQPAATVVSAEYNQIKEESARKIEERKLRATNNNLGEDTELQELSQDDLDGEL